MRIIKAVYAFVSVVAVALLLNVGEVYAEVPRAEPITERPTILVWGDSLSAAYGIPVDRGWVSLLQAKYEGKYAVVNGSISGETTQGGLSRLPDALELQQGVGRSSWTDQPGVAVPSARQTSTRLRPASLAA